ncbi:hypothetical protein ACWCRH_31045, partial [Streptomyces sp. NPDC002399]
MPGRAGLYIPDLVVVPRAVATGPGNRVPVPRVRERPVGAEEYNTRGPHKRESWRTTKQHNTKKRQKKEVEKQ